MPRPFERDRVVVALVARRRAMGLTQAAVGRKMGTTQSAVSELESGADCRLSTLKRYAAAVGATLMVSDRSDTS